MEALLGSAAEAIEVSDLSTARRIFAQLEQEQIGSVVLRIAELGGGGAPAAEPPSGLCPAASALARIDDGHPAAAILASCYIADDLGAFLDFWRAHPEFPFLSVATRKGEVVDRRGIVSGGHASPKKHATASSSARSTCARRAGRSLRTSAARPARRRGEALNAGWPRRSRPRGAAGRR